MCKAPAILKITLDSMNYSLHTDVEDYRHSLNQIVTYDLKDDPLQSIDAQQTDKDGVGKVALGKWKTLFALVEWRRIKNQFRLLSNVGNSKRKVLVKMILMWHLYLHFSIPIYWKQQKEKTRKEVVTKLRTHCST